MQITRRRFAGGLATGAAALAGGTLARPALAAADDIRIGWVPSLTGPSSSPGIGFNRGVIFAANEINAAGGRKVEIITRDTQGDPSKAVNATVELISRQKVHAIWGPVNSGEALATTPIMTRYHMPTLHPDVVDSLIDPAKFPTAFRLAPNNDQWDAAARHYCLDILKLRDVALVGDTTGYGTTAVADSARNFTRDGAHIAHQALIDAAQPDVSADMARLHDSGAKVVVIWSVSAGFLARLMNARAQLNWDVPFVGHPALGSGEVRNLLTKPSNWDKVYAVGYRSCSFDSAGNLPPRSAEFVKRLAGKVELSDTSLWWVACGYDAVQLVAKAVQATNSTAPEAIIGHWNGLKAYPGMFGDYTFTPTEHNGYPTGEVVMSLANSQRDGAYALAPGYGT